MMAKQKRYRAVPTRPLHPSLSFLSLSLSLFLSPSLSFSLSFIFSLAVRHGMLFIFSLSHLHFPLTRSLAHYIEKEIGVGRLEGFPPDFSNRSPWPTRSPLMYHRQLNGTRCPNTSNVIRNNGSPGKREGWLGKFYVYKLSARFCPISLLERSFYVKNKNHINLSNN